MKGFLFLLFVIPVSVCLPRLQLSFFLVLSGKICCDLKGPFLDAFKEQMTMSCEGLPLVIVQFGKIVRKEGGFLNLIIGLDLCSLMIDLTINFIALFSVFFSLSLNNVSF